MSYYSWGWFGSSPAIGNLGPDVNTKGDEPDSHLEIVTGSDEYCRYYPELGANACGIWRVLDSGGNIEWAKSTETDEARSSPAIVDIDGDGDFEIAGGTTSGWNVEVLNHRGSFVWTFPWPPRTGGLFMWPSSPAIADLNPAVSGLEVVIGSNYLGSVWAFDGDNSDGINDGITADLSWYPYSAGTEGIHWDVLWVFQTGGSVVATPAIADVDKDGELEVIIGSTDGNLYVLNGINGTPEAIFPTGGAIYSSAAVANLDGDPYLEIVVGSTDGKLYAFSWDGSTAKTKWTFATGGPFYSSPAIGDVDGDGALEVVVGSNDGKVYALTASGAQEWSYATGGAVYSSPALANRDSATPYQRSWPMFRHDERRTGYHGPPLGKPLAVYVGSDDHYLYVLDGRSGSLIDRFLTYGPIHTSPSVADVDGDKKLEIFFYDWGTGSSYGGHTFWAVKDQGGGFWTTSYYIGTTQGEILYRLGCELGTRHRNLPGTQDNVVILAFGAPLQWTRRGQTVYGATLWQGPDASTGEIATAVQEFAKGYYECTDDSSQLRIVIGTSNWGGYVTKEHGQAWAQMVNEVGSWLERQGFGSRVRPAGGIDAEVDFNSAENTKDWVQGYADKAKWPLSDFGSADGCPSEELRSTCQTPRQTWTLGDRWYVAWGAMREKGLQALPLPQIYNSKNAKQWKQLSLYSLLQHGEPIHFAGSLTQYQACQQRGCDASEKNTPEQGWTQLYNVLNSDARTAQDLPWATDIKWWPR